MHLHRTPRTLGLLAGACVLTACEGRPPSRPTPPAPTGTPLAQIVIGSEPGVARPPFGFSREDEQFLGDVERGAFNFLWNAGASVGPGMVPDRTSKPAVSVAGVGFQLSGICVGVERGWITREEGEGRATAILKALSSNPENRKAGMFFHFIDPTTAGQPKEAYEQVASTIDSSLLMAGVLTASQYFGGEVRALGDKLFREVDWSFFVMPSGGDPVNQGYISLGWKPKDHGAPTGDGSLLPFAWIDSGDEHRLVTFLAVCAPEASRRVEPGVYYRLRRQIGEYGDTGPFVWLPWSGAMFTAFFSHCWLDYAAMGPDNPSAFNIPNRPRVDWWENSRRTARMQKLKAIENPKKVPTLGEHAWGLTASDVQGGYAVPGLFPTPLPMPGAIPQIDYAVFDAKDDYGDGTVAPYGAGSCIMFDPAGALDALRYYRSLARKNGSPLVWSDPAKGGYGFFDAFNLGTGWVSSDCIAIDQGPLLLAIENARTGLLWRIFHAHPWVRDGMDRLRLGLNSGPASPNK